LTDAEKILVGVERCYVEYDGDMIPSPTGSWICYHEALEAITPELDRLKGLVGRYAKHLAHTGSRQQFDRTSPWLTFEERQELKSYAERPF